LKKDFIMLQASEIQKRFTHLQQTVSEASRTCHADSAAPNDLMNWMDELEKECQSAMKVMATSDEERMRQCIEDLERIGDRAERACEQANSVTESTRDAITSMHSELSDLKRQLH
jgi:phosphate uptake regulator